MNYRYYNLEDHLKQGLRAWRNSHLMRGLSISLLGIMVIAAAAALAQPLYREQLLAWLGIMAVPTITWGFLTWRYLVSPLRKKPDLQKIARYLEERHPGLEDRLATAVEFGKQKTVAENQLLDKLIDDAISQSSDLDFSRELRITLAGIWRAVAVVTAVLLAFSFFRLSDLFKLRLGDYFAAPPETQPAVESLEVTPGDVRIPRGETVEVIAQTPQIATTTATIYLEGVEDAWTPVTMNLTAQLGKFTYNVFDVRDTVRYYVKIAGELSPIYEIVPLDAPEIKSFRTTYRYPAEIGLRPSTQEGSGDVYAPKGTAVQIDMIVSQPLAKAEWRLGKQSFTEIAVVSDSIARVSFKVENDSYYVPRLTNRDGMTNREVEYFIHATPDEPPQITIMKPGRDLRPSMLEEVAFEAKVYEDFGLKSFVFVYSQNNQEAVNVDLLADAVAISSPDASRKEFVAKTLLYLEDLQVVPGDFVSYYFEAEDAQQQITSDLFFLEVRPFEEEFYQPLSQGGGGSGDMAGSLAVSQKEIITATWNLVQKRRNFSEEELQQSSQALHASQLALKESMESLAQNIQLRGSFTGEGSETNNMVRYLEQAAQSMAAALPPLEQVELEAALPPEREAYHFLLKVDAEIRRRELTQGSSSGASMAQLQNRDELSQLFRDELDKIQSKYETFQNSQQQQIESRLNEAQQKVRELAQRQERLVELNQQLERTQDSAQDRRRQIERLRREQEQINRDIQNLRRQMQQMSGRSAANSQGDQRLLDNLKQTADDMQRALDNLQRQNTSRAAADGKRALERLQQLEDDLQRRQANSLRDHLTQLREDFHDLAVRQSQLSDELADRPADASPPDSWQEQQAGIQRETENAIEELERARRSAAQDADHSAVGEDLKKALSTLERENAKEQLSRANQALEQQEYDRALEAQRRLAESLQKTEELLKQSLSRLSQTQEEQLDLALLETQRLRRQLESALRQAQERSGAAPEGSGADNQGEPGRESGETAAAGGPGRAPQSAAGAGEALQPEDMEWWSDQAWEGLRQLENVKPFLRSDSALALDHERALQDYRGVLQTFRGGNPQRLREIEQSLIDPVRRLEAELATRLAVLKHQERMLTVIDEQVPPQYREMVDAYFERLSRSRK